MKRMRLLVVLIMAVFGFNTMPAFAASTIYVDGDQCYAIKKDGTLWTWEYGNSDECEKILDDVKSVASNYAIKTNGDLWTWGKSLFGEFDKPVKVMEDVNNIEANDMFAFIVKNDKSLWAVGANDYNNMGLIDYRVNTDIPVKIINNVQKAVIGESHGIILKTDGNVMATGLNKHGQLSMGKDYFTACRTYVDINNVTDIYAGTSSSYANRNNMLWMWGTTYEFDETGGIYFQYTPKEYLGNVKQLVSRTGYDIILKDNGNVWFCCAERLKKKGCFDTLDFGVLYLDLPYHVIDNANCISEGRSDYRNKALILSNDGILYECSVEMQSKFVGRVDIKPTRINDIKEYQYEEDTEIHDYTDIKNCLSKKEIRALTRADIMHGVTDDQFMPEKSVSRADTAALLLRMTGKENETADTDFSDVEENCWYYNIAGLTQRYGIIEGYDDNTFRGEETVSDLQMVVLASRTLRNEGTAIELEEDVTVPKNIPEWAEEDVEYALKYGIITQEEACKLSDEKDMTRGEAAVILYQLYRII